ncbi:MAG: aspartate-semialdehyde dehydrogenase [Clostridia bacterium]|nr:aspartate-semialdehyde dehydrogenase [Clostridia bacterium]
MKKYKICIVGASGLVGEKLIDLLNRYNFPISKIFLYASKRSAGKIVKIGEKSYKIRKLTTKFAKKVDFTFFMTDAKISSKYIPYCLNSTYVIDNSSAFRLKDNVPLIVPEINFSQIKDARVISNPNCTTAICALPIYLISKLYKITNINACSYQSVSGFGYKGLNALNNKDLSKKIFNEDITQTCIPKIGEYLRSGYTTEEQKLIDETKKIFNNSELKISATCVRVPIPYCHSVVLQITTEQKMDLNMIKNAFKQDKLVIFCNEDELFELPTCPHATNNEKIFVGRMRLDLSKENTLLLFITGDNLMRGAAYNAYRIMEKLIDDSL